MLINHILIVYFKELLFLTIKIKGGGDSRISGKGVHMYKGVGC